MAVPSPTAKPRPNLLSVLRCRNFTLLWGGQAISQLGDSLFSVALMWLVLQLTGSALALGAIPILAMLPRIAFQLIGGAWVDRYDRRSLMIASDAIRGMVMLVLALLVATGQIQLIHIYTLQVIFGIVSAFFSPAVSALIPNTVPKEGLIAANSLASLAQESTQIIGPDLAGVLIAIPSIGMGGGLGLWYSNATIYHNTIGTNTAGWGGALSLLHSDATVSANVVISNTAYDGGGIALGYSSATLNDNLVFSNTASLWGGGLYLYFSDASLTGNAVISNSAELGGGVLLDVSHARLNGNTVIANSANEGGGLLLGRSHATLTNNVVADNRANTLGSGIYLVVASLPHLSHNTIAHNTGGDGSGIYVTDGSAVVLTNSILVGHTVGISVAAGNTATLEATLWGDDAWANGADWGGAGTILTGTHDYWGDPAFVDPDGGDYHIGPGSPALDVGVDAGVTQDIDGEPRPSGLGYDLGADEFLATTGSGYSIYLPVVMRQSP